MFADKKILFIIPERLGDALMCTPALHYIKLNYPTAKIDVFAYSQLAADTLKNNPDFEHLYTHLNELQLPYDFGINIHGESFLKDPFEKLNIKIYDLPPIDYTRPQAEFALEFLKRLSPEHAEITERHYRLFPTQQDRDYIHKILVDHKVDFKKDILIGCQIGCHGIAQKKWAIFRKKLTHPKIWPFEYYLELAKRLYKTNPHIRLVLTGSHNEKILGNKILKKIPNAISFIDKTSVLQLRALIDEMDLFLSPDTGVMHVASSADIPMIALFGPTNLARTGPYPKLNDLTVLQAEKMEDIPVDTVFNAVMQKISHHLQ